MTSSRLGTRLLEWLKQLFAYLETTKLGTWFVSWFGWIKENHHTISYDLLQGAITGIAILPAPEAKIVSQILSLVTGIQTPVNTDKQMEELKLLVNNPQQYMIKAANYMANNPTINSIADAMGSIIEDVLITPMEDFVSNNPHDPHAFLVRFHGKIAAVALASHTLSLIAEITGLGQIESVAYAVHEAIENMGLANAGAAIIEPLVTQTVRMQETRYYNKRYRPRRWTAGELNQLYALREITEAEFKDQMSEWGYLDSDIMKALHVSESHTGIEMLVRGYNLNMIDKQALASFLHRRGYAPEDIDFIIQTEDESKRQNDLNAISSIALQAYKKGLLSRQEYINMRIAGRVPRDRINIELELADLEMKATKSDLTTGNIKAAFMNNVIARAEAVKYLQDEGIDQQAINIMMDTWIEEKSPKVLRLNANTILAGYVDGILNETQTLNKLEGLGWSKEDSQLQLSITKLRIENKPRPLSEAGILSAYHNGLLSQPETIDRLKSLGYDDMDVHLIIEMADMKPVQSTKLLSEARIIKLYQLDVFGVVEAIQRLVMLGYDEDTANLALIADTTKIPKTNLTQ